MIYPQMLGVQEVMESPEFAEWILQQPDDLLQAPAEVLWGLYIREQGVN